MPLIVDSESIYVLVLDDDKSDAVLTERALSAIEGAKVRVDHACTLEQALVSMKKGMPDLMMIDYRLGPITGIDAMRRMQDEGHSVPMILMTGQGCEETAAEALRTGAADYVVKSAITSKGMERAIRNAIEKHRLREMVQTRNRELERKNAELHRKSEQISNFYHTLSHELKTPLTSTREFISIVADGLAGPTTSQQQEYLKIASDGCDLLTVYINDMLDVTRMETGKLSLEKADHELGGILEAAINAMRPMAEQKQIELALDNQAGGVRVSCDPARIRQVLANLINNAIKFTDEGGHIELGAARKPSNESGEVLVSVKDDGRGIATEFLTDVFEHFYQVRGDRATSQEGLGLGLSLCKQLVEAHDGSVWVESTLEVGSTFFFTLPLVNELETVGHE